jgi:hypothetical protein
MAEDRNRKCQFDQDMGASVPAAGEQPPTQPDGAHVVRGRGVPRVVDDAVAANAFTSTCPPLTSGPLGGALPVPADLSSCSPLRPPGRPRLPAPRPHRSYASPEPFFLVAGLAWSFRPGRRTPLAPAGGLPPRTCRRLLSLYELCVTQTIALMVRCGHWGVNASRASPPSRNTIVSFRPEQGPDAAPVVLQAAPACARASRARTVADRLQSIADGHVRPEEPR